MSYLATRVDELIKEKQLEERDRYVFTPKLIDELMVKGWSMKSKDKVAYLIPNDDRRRWWAHWLPIEYNNITVSVPHWANQHYPSVFSDFN